MEALVGKIKGYLRLFLTMLKIGLFTFGGGMLLFMMVSMITPLGSTIINVALCAAGGALFAFGLGAISKAVLKKTSLV